MQNALDVKMLLTIFTTVSGGTTEPLNMEMSRFLFFQGKKVKQLEIISKARFITVIKTRKKNSRLRDKWSILKKENEGMQNQDTSA